MQTTTAAPIFRAYGTLNSIWSTGCACSHSDRSNPTLSAVLCRNRRAEPGDIRQILSQKLIDQAAFANLILRLLRILAPHAAAKLR